MFLRKSLYLKFLILYEIVTFVNTEEYLKNLKPKDIKLNINDDLPPVEIPRPIILQRQAKSQELSGGDFEDESRRQKSQRPTLLDIALEASVREGLNAMRRLYSVVEPDMVKKGHVLQDNHPAALLSKFSAPVVESTRREMAAYATLTAAKAFRKNYEFSYDLARQAHTQKISLRRTALESLCPPRDHPTCMPASERYRTHDGTCNNKRRLRWGSAQMPFNRFLPPEYGDGVDSTRVSADGGSLSSSRFVSLLVHGARDGEASLTLMLAQWGQLLDHDLTATAQPRSINGSVPSCCGNKDFHPSCFPIKVPLDDPWLSPLKVRCLEFLRSAPAQRRDCVLSWREQTNQVTSYIDASPIYSSSVKSSDNSRVFRNGLLIFGRGNPADDVCQRGAIATHCIRSGDGRSGEQPGLLALHHVWVHEHNHIAMKLSEMNLHWSDEKIYQETRRIIGAMFQHITYREFLPIVLGREVVKLFDLELLNSGYFEGYDPKTNPTVANAFAAAAFRFGHSLVQNSYTRCDRFHNVLNNNVSLHEEFQRGDIGSVGSLHRLVRGMASQRALKRDEFITPELTNHLFQTPGFPFGLDLAAINIQRGRDHGVPPYTHWRVPCGLTPISNWEEFANVVGPESARRISHAYHSVHDIDLFVGGIAERPVVGGLVGPTFACIIAQQFSNSRKGDRFWYENAGFESSFTPAQLHAIRRVSLASVLCRAVGGGTFQPHIFLPAEFANNDRLPCGVGQLGDFDINPWLEQDPFANIIVRTTQPPTFKPQHMPDRIFQIMDLETKSPVVSETHLSDNKVGFSNRRPPITILKDTPPSLTHNPTTVNNVEFIPNSSIGFQRIQNGTNINDKLDLKTKGTQGHVTKQKPVPGVNSKLDKSNRKDANRHGLIQTTTRRTIVVNNIPIELRNADQDQSKITKNKNLQTETNLEPRIEDSELITESSSDNIKVDNENTELKSKLKIDNTVKLDESLDNLDILKPTEHTEHTQETNSSKESKINFNSKTENTADNTVDIEARTDDMEIRQHTEPTTNINSKVTTKQTKLERTDDIEITDHNAKTDQSEINSSIHLETTIEDLELPKLSTLKTNSDQAITFVKLDSILTVPNDINKKTMTTTRHLRETTFLLNSDITQEKPTNTLLTETNSTLKLNYSDIDPMVHATPRDHKRVQRTLTPPKATEQLKDKPKFSKLDNIVKNNISTTTTKKSLTTKSPKPIRTTLRNVELRQYQSRPSYTKPPQKVIVDSANGDNQYEIEINIRQTNKSPKPLQSTPNVADYTNGHNTNHYNRYTPSYHTYTTTTPSYAYFQPAPTQIASLPQNQRTKPPTIIFLNEHEQDRTSTRIPGFLHSILGWSSGTKRPLPQSIGVNDRPGYEAAISSPHSSGVVQPAYQNLRPSSQVYVPGGSTSFSQAQLAGGIVQASSTAISNGNFGSIAGFASANGADSTFSFNIRQKPDKSQNSRPEAISGGIVGSYGLTEPPRNPWYTQKPEYINLPITSNQHISPSYDIPKRENVFSPFSTSNSQTYYVRNKPGPQRKEFLSLANSQEYADYDYTSRTLEPFHNHNITSSDETDDMDINYEYDEDFGTSPLLRKFNQDGYLRPEHMIGTVLHSVDGKTEIPTVNSTNTDANDQLLNDNYVLPVLNSSKELPAANLPKPLHTNFSTEFPDSFGKHLNNDIFAEEQQEQEEEAPLKSDMTDTVHISILKNKENRKNNKIRSHEKIAFAPINVLTKPERPDNWVIFDSPKEESLLPELPEIIMDPIPSAEIPKPFKENNWLDITNLKRKLALKSPKLISNEQTTTPQNFDSKTPEENNNNLYITPPDQADLNGETLTDFIEKNSNDLENRTLTDNTETSTTTTDLNDKILLELHTVDLSTATNVMTADSCLETASEPNISVDNTDIRESIRVGKCT